MSNPTYDELDRKYRSEKASRLYYQDIVYDVCNLLDKWNGKQPGTGIVCGTAADPTKQVQIALSAVLAMCLGETKTPAGAEKPHDEADARDAISQVRGLVQFFRTEAIEAGHEGDRQGWCPVQTAIDYIRSLKHQLFAARREKRIALEEEKSAGHRLSIFDEQLTNVSAAADAMSEHFDDAGNIKGDGKWRLAEIAKHFGTIRTEFRIAVDKLNALQDRDKDRAAQ